MNIRVWWKCAFLTSAVPLTVLVFSLHMPGQISNTEIDRSSEVEYSNQMTRNGLGIEETNASSSELQEQRKRHLATACRHLAPPKWTTNELQAMTNSLFVDDRLRCIYCLVPKVASSTWTRVLFVASGKVKAKNPNDLQQSDVNWLRLKGKKLRPLSWYEPSEIIYRLKSYYKFMFVRHPIHRLVSAYRDRLLDGEHGKPQALLTDQILSQFLTPNQLAYRKRGKKGVTFPEFVRYVVDPRNNPSNANPHWRPQYHICHPCNIDYDFIGHFETLRTDAQVVLDAIHAVQNVTFPERDRDPRKHASISDLREKLFRKVPAEHQQLLSTKIYAMDFELFGYEYEELVK